MSSTIETDSTFEIQRLSTYFWGLWTFPIHINVDKIFIDGNLPSYFKGKSFPKFPTDTHYSDRKAFHHPFTYHIYSVNFLTIEIFCLSTHNLMGYKWYK